MGVLLEGIPVLADGEFFAEALEVVIIQNAGFDGFLVGLGLGNQFAFGVDYLRKAAVVDAFGVVAHAVHADIISLVFDGPGFQEGVPNIHS